MNNIILISDSDQFKDGKEDSSSDERDRDCRMRRCNSLDVKRKKQNTSEGSSRQSSLDKNPGEIEKHSVASSVCPGSIERP